MEEEFDLDKIDTEMRMEKIRQSSSKLTWDSFGQALRRNLMEKRLVFDAESRMDVIQAINFMRRTLPVDTNADTMAKLKQLAEGLECTFNCQDNLIVIRNAEIHVEIFFEETVKSCKIGYFGRPLVASEEACALILKDDYETLRTSIYSILATVPSLHNSTEKMDCVAALETMEASLNGVSGPPTFDKVNSLPTGWLQKRDSLHPSRLFYVVPPYYILSTDRKNFDIDIDCANLPYLEVSIVHNDKEVELPIGGVKDPYGSVKSMSMCFCLKFSVPLLFSEINWRKMEKYLARPSIVRQHVNAYRYTSEFDFKTNEELVLRTSLPSHIMQHRYTIPAEFLKEENDVVIGELYINDMSNLDKVIALIRAQEMHNCLWESFLAMSSGRWKSGNSVKMKVFPSSTRFEIQFSANDRLVVVRIEPTKEGWVAVMKKSDGSSVSADIDKQLTSMLIKSHNIPCTLTRAVNALQARGSPDPADDATSPCDSRVISSFLDKIGDAWLPQPKPPRREQAYVYEVQIDENPIALLASFKDFEEEEDDVYTPAPARPEALSRNVRQPSDQSYAHAFSDLEAICQIAQAWEGESKPTTPAVAASPAHRMPGGITQLSPLETARLRMAQSVNASSAGHPSTPDIFDFPDDRSGGSGSSYPSPSPHSNSFTYGVSSPVGRGGAAAGKRRPRQRKGNLGDRTASTDSLTGQDPFGAVPPGQKKPRMTGKPAAVRKPRGPRKSSGTPMSQQELEVQQRPTLQRSFSDYVNMATSFPSATPSVSSPYAEEESDDEACDPPPPPKNILPAPSQHPSHSQAIPSHLPPQPSSSLAAEQTAPLRIQPVRKTSLDFVPPTKKASAPVATQRKIKNMMSDIFDDGVGSPDSPPEKAIPAVASIISQNTQSPAAFGSPKAEGEGTSGGLPGILKPDGNKLILKISKSRASPSVDAQKAKLAASAAAAPGSSAPKAEKKKREPKERDREKEKAARERKRKAEPSGKEKEHKRHKSEASSKQKATPMLPFMTPTLKNFKIPKREDPKDASKEPGTPTTPVAPTLPSPVAAAPTPFPPVVAPMPVPPHKPSISRKSSSSSHMSQQRMSSYGHPPSSHIKKHDQRRSSLGHPTHMSHGGPSVSNIPLPKAPPPRPPALPPKPNQGGWVRPPTTNVHQQPPPRSPSPEVNMQIDDEPNSPEDSLRIAEE